MRLLPVPAKLLLLLLMLACCLPAAARKKKPKGETEAGLVAKLVHCMQKKDAYAYLDLFPDADSMAAWILRRADTNSREFQMMAWMQENPEHLMRRDSLLAARLIYEFDSLMQRGEELYEIRWPLTVHVRYELVKTPQTRNELYERLAPLRYTGYIFIMDGASRKRYGVMVSDMMQIEGRWYGGRLLGIYPGATQDEVQKARLAELRPGFKKTEDSARLARQAEQEAADDADELLEPAPSPKTQKLIVDRKFYTGKLDDEIPVQLYIRYLKGGCPEVVCSYEAIYKFGDQDGYVKLLVSKGADGKWTFTEQPEAAVMELVLNKDTYTGSWISTDDQTGYEVRFTETPATNSKLRALDAVIQKQLYAR